MGGAGRCGAASQMFGKSMLALLPIYDDHKLCQQWKRFILWDIAISPLHGSLHPAVSPKAMRRLPCLPVIYNPENLVDGATGVYLHRQVIVEALTPLGRLSLAPVVKVFKEKAAQCRGLAPSGYCREAETGAFIFSSKFELFSYCRCSIHHHQVHSPASLRNFDPHQLPKRLNMSDAECIDLRIMAACFQTFKIN